MTAATEQQVAAACIAAVNAQLTTYGAGISALDLDDARDVTAEHVQVTLSRRYQEQDRGGRQSTVALYRLTTRPVADTVGNAREIYRRVSLALTDVNLAAAGQHSTPIHFESADDIGEDDGRYSGLTQWTFAI